MAYCFARFADLNLRSPVLSYIKVSRCSALHRVSITSSALQVSPVFLRSLDDTYWIIWILMNTADC
jgi:hypothetical protein